LLQQVTARFEEAYARQFGRALGISAMEAITWRVRAAGAKPPFNLSPQVAVAKDQPAQTASRRVYFGPEHGHADCPIFNRYLLKAGAKGVGPALLEERETTVVVGPGAQWAVDAYLNLLVDL
jgi:N-methylhydantoinase A